MIMEEIKTNQYPKADLARVLYTILYLIIGRFISMVLFIIAVCQFIYSWLIGEPNERLLYFTDAMSEYSKQLVLYVGFNSDERPWPVGNWPSVEGE
jgi:hypothetical protein